MDVENLKPEELRYGGVNYHKITKRWKVFIKYNRKTQYLGTFHKLKDAVETYDHKAIETWDKNAITNKWLIENGKKLPLTDKFDCPIPDVADLEGEIWKDITGFEQSYKISTMGRIKSLARPNIIKEIILTPREDKKGYLMVVLRKNKSGFNQKIHRLVGFAFIDNPNNLPQINHKNMNKKDNRVENLEWMTNKDNVIHEIKNNLFRKKSMWKAKLTHEQVKEIRKLNATGLYKKVDLAKTYNVSGGNISALLSGRTWKDVI